MDPAWGGGVFISVLIAGIAVAGRTVLDPLFALCADDAMGT